MSTVLLGRRRMGKTEIFKRVVNRLFFEQDPLDPMAVVPVYYTFPAYGADKWEFAENYLENFIRYYIGFYTRQPGLILGAPKGQELLAAVEQARSLYSFRQTLDWVLGWYNSIRQKDVPIPVQTALEAIRRVSDVDDTTIVVFLDEFQNTRLSQNQFDMVGYLQEAVESPTCPILSLVQQWVFLPVRSLGAARSLAALKVNRLNPFPPTGGQSKRCAAHGTLAPNSMN